MSGRSLIPGAVSGATLTLVLVAGCGDGVSAPPVAMRGLAPSAVASPAAAPSKSTLPTGKGFGINNDPNPLPRTKYRIEYHNQRVLTGPQNVYLIWYGDWTNKSLDQTIVGEMVATIGGTPYLNVVRLYSDSRDSVASSWVVYAGAVNDAYSHSSILSDDDIKDIVDQKIVNFEFPADPQGIYVVLASPDVSASSGQVSSYCAMHGTTPLFGANLRFIYVGGPLRSLVRCAPQAVGPNGTSDGDGMAYLLAGQLADVVTDPFFGTWYDRYGLEVADKCAWTYGTTYKAPNGALANVRLSQRDYLLPQLWIPSKSGGTCALHW